MKHGNRQRNAARRLGEVRAVGAEPGLPAGFRFAWTLGVATSAVRAVPGIAQAGGGEGLLHNVGASGTADSCLSYPTNELVPVRGAGADIWWANALRAQAGGVEADHDGQVGPAEGHWSGGARRLGSAGTEGSHRRPFAHSLGSRQRAGFCAEHPRRGGVCDNRRPGLLPPLWPRKEPVRGWEAAA